MVSRQRLHQIRYRERQSARDAVKGAIKRGGLCHIRQRLHVLSAAIPRRYTIITWDTQ